MGKALRGKGKAVGEPGPSKMNKRTPGNPVEHIFVSAETIHTLYPRLPLDDLPQRNSLYDALAAFDLARALGLVEKKNTPSTSATGTDQLPQLGPDLKFKPSEVLVVDGKEYFSTRITARQTGYTQDHLRQLMGTPGTGLVFVRHDIPNGLSQALFWDIESVKAYRARKG